MQNISSKIVIVGAGPAGLLLAHYLLRCQYQVAIYDRRPDPRKADPNQNRSFPISLQDRGRKALRGIPGLEDAIAAQSTFCQGTVLHNKRKSRDIKRKNVVLTIDRNRLVLTLLEQLIIKYPEAAQQLYFGYTCQEINDNQKKVTFSNDNHQEISVDYDFLIGADGARSQVRKQLAEKYGLKSEETYVRDAYKSIFLARTNSKKGIELAPDRIHASNFGKDSRIVLAPQSGDCLHGAFIFNAAKNPLEGFTSKEEIVAYFQEKLPTFCELMSEEEAEALLHRPVARLVTVKCDRFHHGNHILILGDAAHAVSPSIGQGCNSALQDVYLVNQLLDTYQNDFSQIPAQFSQQRVADAHALRDLSDYSFPRSKLLIVEFFLRLTLGRKLHTWFPHWFKPFLFDQILDTDLSYSEVLHLNSKWINKVKKSMA